MSSSVKFTSGTILVRKDSQSFAFVIFFFFFMKRLRMTNKSTNRKMLELFLRFKVCVAVSQSSIFSNITPISRTN